MSKKIAKAQQAAVSELEVIQERLERLLDGIEPDGKWFPGEDFGFAEGQVNTMIGIAADQVRQVILAFEDCCEDGVTFKDRS